MRLLDRYLLRELLVPLGYCLGGFMIFWLAFQVIAEMGEIQRSQLRPGEVLLYLFYTMPKALRYVMPMGLLLALLYALTNHARHHELTAMRCAGVSLWRLLVPYLAVGLGCGLGLFVVNEILMPHAEDEAEGIINRQRNQPEAETAWHRHLTFFQYANGRTNVVGPFDFHNVTAEMRKPHVIWHTPDGGRLDLSAERGEYRQGHWHFYQVQENIYPPGQVVPSERRLTNYLALPELTTPPGRIRSEIKVNSMSDFKAARRMSLSLVEIFEYKRWHPERRSDPQLDTKLHSRLAAPATCLVVVLIAVPFSARSGRRNVFVGVASSIFVGFVFFILQGFGEAAGMSGRLPAWVAAWLPNLVFFLAGVVMITKTR
jgi:LPS export ABC transporter permease LptG